MKTKISPILAVALSAVTLMFWLPLQSHAASKAGTLSDLSGQGTLYGGGSIHYRLSVTNNTAGTLTVQAQIKGKGWKAKFPILTSDIDAGGATVDSTAIPVPAGFFGNASLKVKATLSGGKLGNIKVTVTIGTPPPPSSSVQTTLYDVGFDNNVTLNGTVVSTSGMGVPLTYSWTQTSGNAVSLNASDVVSPNFTTDPITTFVDMGTALYNNDIDDAGFTNQIYVAPEHRFGTNTASTTLRGIALEAEHADVASYGFRLVVSDGSIMRTGTFTVACSSLTPAQPNIPVGVTAYYMGATNSQNWSLLSKPAGSAAALTHTNDLIAQLRPDVEGVYVIQDNVTGKTLTNTAASYTGYQFCAICHGPGNNVNQEDMVTPWSKTLHASMAQRGVDGVLSSHYSEACFQCHTVGFNQSPAATNGNFWAVQQTVGWQFPSILQPGNFAAMPVDLQNKANIQCESCHGPGSRHPGSPSISLDVKVCAQCHEDGSHHVKPEQWKISPHAGAYESLSTHNSASCARCHVPAGFISVAKGVSPGITNAAGATAVVTGPTGPATCQVCHDPHDTFDNADRHQLRVYDTVQLGNPLWSTSPTVTIGLGDSLTTANLQLTNSTITVTNAGASAACMVCHNAREWPTQIQVSGSSSNKMYYATTAPSMSTAGDVFAGLGGYDYGQPMGNSFHTYLADCQSCHMYQLKAGDTILTNDVPVVITSTNLDTYANVLGDHTFKMDYQSVDANGVTNVVDNIAACNQCHASFEPVGSFDFQPSNGHDYDGNGSMEGIQTETRGLMRNLETLIYATGVQDTVNSRGSISKFGGGFSTNSVGVLTALGEAQRRAVWNWSLENYEGSFGVHNSQFTIRLLQSSYTDLSTNTVPPGNPYSVDFPAAFIR